MTYVGEYIINGIKLDKVGKIQLANTLREFADMLEKEDLEYVSGGVMIETPPDSKVLRSDVKFRVLKEGT